MPYVRFSGKYVGEVAKPTFREDGMVVYWLRDCKVTSTLERFLSLYAPFSPYGMAEVALAKMGL